MHMYYFTLSGPMDQARYDFLVARGIFTHEEADELAKQPGSPPAIVYAWAVHVVKTAFGSAPQVSYRVLRIQASCASTRA